MIEKPRIHRCKCAYCKKHKLQTWYVVYPPSVYTTSIYSTWFNAMEAVRLFYESRNSDSSVFNLSRDCDSK